MKVTRKDTWETFDANWCPQCAGIVVMKTVHTGMPGICAKTCNKCGAHYQANYLEDANDLMTIPDSFVMLPK